MISPARQRYLKDVFGVEEEEEPGFTGSSYWYTPKSQHTDYSRSYTPKMHKSSLKKSTKFMVDNDDLPECQEDRMLMELARMFMDNIYLEREVEQLKITVAKREDFTHKEAFECFDPSGQGMLNLHAFIEACVDMVGLQGFKPESAHLLFLKYANPGISLQEFSKMILPSDGYAYSHVIKRYRCRLSNETVELLQSLIRAQLSLVQAQDYIRIRLNNVMKNNGWKVPDLFNLLDVNQKGWIGVHEVEHLLRENKRHGKSLAADIQLVLSGMDRSGNKKGVSYADFESFILPKNLN